MDFANAISNTVTSVSDQRKHEASVDAELVKRVQSGDVAAFDRLMRTYRERVYSVVYNMLSNNEDAADITQETFIKAYKSIHAYQSKSSFFTWLYRIAVNTAMNHLKKNKRRHFFSLDTINDDLASNEIVQKLSSHSLTDKSAFVKELQEKLNESLQLLSIKHRTVIVLHEIEGLNLTEVAKVLKCNESTVRTRLHYAKQQLQAYLKDYLT